MGLAVWEYCTATATEKCCSNRGRDAEFLCSKHSVVVDLLYTCTLCLSFFFKILEAFELLPPFLIIGRLTFFTPSLTIRLIQKFVQNINSFVVAYFINTSSSIMS